MKYLYKDLHLIKPETFLNKNKEEIISMLGHGFNYWHADVWSYATPKKFFENRRSLVLVFEDDIVKQSYIRRYYFWDVMK